MQSSSSTSNSEYFSGPLDIEIGTRQQGEQIGLRAVCGVVVNGQPSETVSMWINAKCQENVLRSIKMLSQPQAAGPYRAAGAAEIEWSSKTTILASSDTAMIIEGLYKFPKKHRPCRWMNDCCADDGHVYLDSCRSPIESELEVVKSCLAKGLYSHSDEYSDCLREAGVRTGCEDQANGSRICY